jgi:hypothetical protein
MKEVTVSVKSLPAEVSARTHSAQDRARALVAAVGRYYDLPVKALQSSERSAALVEARAVAMYLVRDETRWSYAECGEYFGGRHHTTVLAAVRRIQMARADSLALERELRDVRLLAEQISEEPEEAKPRVGRPPRALSVHAASQPTALYGRVPWVAVLTSSDFCSDSRIRQVLADLPVGSTVVTAQAEVARLVAEYRLHLVQISVDPHGGEEASAEQGARKLVELGERLVVLWGPSRVGTRTAVEAAERSGRPVEMCGPEGSA